MHRNHILVSLLAIACATSAPAQVGLSPADSTAIRQTLTALTTAATTGHYRELGRFFTEDAVWMAYDQPAVEGRRQVQAWFTVGATDWPHRIIEIAGSGNLAYVRAGYSLKLDLPNFVPITGKALIVMRRQTDHSWLIARYAFNCDSKCGQP